MRLWCVLTALALIGCSESRPRQSFAESFQFRAGVTQLAVTDVQTSARFYCDVLGFQQSRANSQSAELWREGHIKLTLVHGIAKRPPHGWYVLTVGDIEKSLSACKAKGVKINSQPTDWGNGHIDFSIVDPDGNSVFVEN